jgi:hypothetical protein
MKLSKNQIEFIDKFLKRNDVEFVDIREEMIDHIASAVEEKMITDNTDFHDTFVSYVNYNRKELFIMNKNIWRFSFSEIKSYLHYFLKPASLSVNLFLLVLFFLFRTNENVVLFKDNFPFYFMLSMLILSLSNFVYFTLIKKKKYFFIEKNYIVLMILYWINLFLLKPFENNKTISDVLVLLFMMLCATYIFYTKEQIQKYIKLEKRRFL